MATIEALKQRLEAAQELHSVVRTMKSLAAVNIRQYEQAVESLQDYTRTVNLGLAAVLPHLGVNHNHAGRPAKGELGAVFFGTDQGMCGQLNEDVARRGATALEEMARGRTPRILVVGERMAGQMEERGLAYDDAYSVPNSVHGIGPKVQSLLTHLEGWQRESGVTEVHLFYARMVSRVTHDTASLRLLPFDPRVTLNGGEGDEDAGWPKKSIPLITMAPAELFRALVRQHLSIGLFQALAQSLASENSSRLAAMQGAEKNIEERLSALRSEFNQTRQTAITEELLDIVTGFTALQRDGATPV